MNRKGAAHALRQELGEAALDDLDLTILRYVQSWEDDGNPHWIDLAVSFLYENRASTPQVLTKIIARIARRRLAGEEDAAGGASVLKAEEDGYVVVLMTILIECGWTAKDASLLAAKSEAANAGRKGRNAGTLERKYNATRAENFELIGNIKQLIKDDPDGIALFLATLTDLEDVEADEGTPR